MGRGAVGLLCGQEGDLGGGTDSQRFRLLGTPEIIWVAREETGTMRSSHMSGLGLGSWPGPVPHLKLAARLGLGRLWGPHPQGLTGRWETDSAVITTGGGVPQGVAGPRGPGRPWGGRRSDRGITIPKLPERPLCQVHFMESLQPQSPFYRCG